MPNEAISTFGRASEGAHRVHAAATEETPSWHVLWTRSNCEQLVCDQLAAKGYELFLPRVDRWRNGRRGRNLVRAPMFPGYLFLRHAMDKDSYLDVSNTRGLVQILGERWDRLGTVPDREIESIQNVLVADVPTQAHPYLREGQRVRIVRGPLTGTEGILKQKDMRNGLLVLSVDLLQRSVAVKIDYNVVIPV